jgi:primosomal protein N' (replication factor Y)
MPDFNSNERTFQLLAQVVGRVGRNEHQSNVVIQTYQPNHPSIVFGINQDYESFNESAIAERKKNYFPPFTHLLKLTCSFKTESTAINNSRKLFNELKNNIHPDIRIVGPAPAFYERQRGSYRWQIILKSPKREYLIEALKYLPPKYWQYDLDPASLL